MYIQNVYNTRVRIMCLLISMLHTQRLYLYTCLYNIRAHNNPDVQLKVDRSIPSPRADTFEGYIIINICEF